MSNFPEQSPDTRPEVSRKISQKESLMSRVPSLLRGALLSTTLLFSAAATAFADESGATEQRLPSLGASVLSEGISISAVCSTPGQVNVFGRENYPMLYITLPKVEAAPKGESYWAIMSENFPDSYTGRKSGPIGSIPNPAAQPPLFIDGYAGTTVNPSGEIGEDYQHGLNIVQDGTYSVLVMRGAVPADENVSFAPANGTYIARATVTLGGNCPDSLSLVPPASN